MSEIKRQVFLAVMLSIISFLCIRIDLWDIKQLYLSKGEKKRRKEKQSIKELLFYTRYRDQIPKLLILLYYVILIVHLFILICIFSAIYIKSFRNTAWLFVKIAFVFDLVWCAILILLARRPGDRDLHNEQWVKKPIKKKKRR